MLLPVLATGIAVAVVIIVFLSGQSKASKEPKQKNRLAVIKDAQKKLAQNPHSVQGLSELSELYYKEHLWEKSLPLFITLFEIAPAHPEINFAETGLKLGVSAFKLGRYEEALRGLITSYKMNSENFEVNYYLGQTCFEVKDYVKAVPCLKKALAINPSAPNAIKWIGLSLNQQKHYKESLQYCKRALENEPGNKDLLFAMAEGLENVGNTTKAIQVYEHLRNDAVYGARACLTAGMIYLSSNELDKAIPEFEAGMQCQNISPDVLADLRYHLGSSYIKNNEIAKGLPHLKTLEQDKPGYKDTEALITRYQELNQNTNLQIYLLGSNADFAVLCRKLSVAFFPKARIRITELAPQGEIVDMVAEIATIKWEDIIVFRFIRSTGPVNELYIRELHAKIKDTQAGRGFYISAGIFQEPARKYVEGRPIDLIDKAQLAKMLLKID
jgi:tetratricopeptide (TPR) repeat protein